MNQNETSRNGETSPQKPKKDILLPTMIALIGVMAAVLILGASGLIQSGGSASSSSSSGGAVSLAAASSEGYAISSGEPAAAAGGSVSAQQVGSAPSSDSGSDSSSAQSGSAAPQAPAGSGAAGDSGAEQRTETTTTGSAVSQAAPQMHPFSPQDGSSDAPSEDTPSPGSGVSRKTFNALTQGMSYDDVAAAFGDPGTLVDSTGSTEIYEWSGSDSSVRITFKDGVLTHKYQFGL